MAHILPISMDVYRPRNNIYRGNKSTKQYVTYQSEQWANIQARF